MNAVSSQHSPYRCRDHRGARDATDPAVLAWACEVRQALGRIDQRDASALGLIYGQQLTQREAAANLGVPEAEIRRRVARGLVALGRLLTTSAESGPRHSTAQHGHADESETVGRDGR